MAVQFEITPEPTPEEREVLLRALAALESATADPSDWWRAGISEAVDPEPEHSEH